MVPAWTDRGFLPPGRYQVGPEEAVGLLVEDERFESSTTRRKLWSGLEAYISRFLDLEERHRDAVGDQLLIHAIWLGGSYVSTKLDPQNIDLTVFIDERTSSALRGLPGAQWLTKAFNRDSRVAEFGVSPLRVGYRPIVHIFQPDALEAADQAYLRHRGAWDDWWQRCRPDGVDKCGPTEGSTAPRRGYLEVIL